MSNMISIIVPIYNKEDYLEKCLCSIKNQTYNNFECILVDDGSTDSGAVICKNYSKIDQRFRYFYQNNLGVSAARNKGLKESKGKYICFVDADDSLDLDYLENLYKKIKKENVAICISVDSNEKFNNEKGILISSLLNNLNSYYKYDIFNPPWGKLFLKEGIKMNFPESYNLGEDLLFNLQFLIDNQNCNIVFNEKGGYNYSVESSNSISSTVNKKSIVMVSALIQYIYTNFSNQLQIDKILLIQSNSLYNKLLSYYNQNRNFNEVLDFFKNEFKNNYFQLFSIRWKILYKSYVFFGKKGFKIFLDLMVRLKRSNY